MAGYTTMRPGGPSDDVAGCSTVVGRWWYTESVILLRVRAPEARPPGDGVAWGPGRGDVERARSTAGVASVAVASPGVVLLQLQGSVSTYVSHAAAIAVDRARIRGAEEMGTGQGASHCGFDRGG